MATIPAEGLQNDLLDIIRRRSCPRRYPFTKHNMQTARSLRSTPNAYGVAAVGVSADINSSAQSMSGVTEGYNVTAGTSHRMIDGHLAVTSAGTVDVQTSSTGNQAIAALVIRTSAP